MTLMKSDSVPVQPPVDNDHVAPGCELFASRPPPKHWDYRSPVPYRIINETSVYAYVGDVPVADCANGQELHAERNKANAEFIVLACNNHSLLVKALETAEADITGYIESNRNKSLGQMREEIRAALSPLNRPSPAP